MRSLFLASATAPALRRLDQISHAARAGFDGVGLRCDIDVPNSSEVIDLHKTLSDTGLSVLDIEVIRIGNEVAGVTDVLFEVAGALGARSILTVSDSKDRAFTVNRLGELAERAAQYELTIALEFMLFTAVKTLSDALSIINEVGRPEIRLLPDVLHVARSGSAMSELSQVHHLIDYVQLCDAPAQGPQGNELLIREARYERLMPGEGQLDLLTFLQSAPLMPISVEVQSSALQKEKSPLEITHLAYRSARRVLEQLDHRSITNE